MSIVVLAGPVSGESSLSKRYRQRPEKAGPHLRGLGSLGARETTAVTAPSPTAPRRADRAAQRSARASWRAPASATETKRARASSPAPQAPAGREEVS